MNSNTDGPIQVAKDNYYRTLNTFVKTQIRLLETTLRLPGDWRNANRTQKEDQQRQHHHEVPIPDHIVSAGLKKLNTTTQKAVRLNFSSQSVHQLLEQMIANQLQVKRRHRQGGIVVRTKSRQELLDTAWIDAFPIQWRSSHEKSAGIQEQGEGSTTSANTTATSDQPDTRQVQQYQALRATIVELQQKYRIAKEKHEFYKDVQLLDSSRLQANVVGPNTPISQELAKMKSLVPRLVNILEVRKETLVAKRKREHENLSMDDPDNQVATKRQHAEPTDPMETMLSLL
ncbi:hypothetical protein BGW41_002596 [Actinomortierella wolfii]|nr:hypothetical protein BGW41_002596 [Actinomortierella wolfii]